MYKPNVGHINFINCLPLTYGWRFGYYSEGLQLYSAVPSELNAMILDGMLDVSPVSSIIYARNSERFSILPNVSINSDGDIQSILLVSKRPIEDLAEARIALTSKSATSHCLLKIVLNKAYHLTPEYFISGTSLDGGVLNEADAVLFIGDEALYSYHNRRSDLYYYDIGIEWKKLTGLPMVYAVWIVNKQFAFANPEALQAVYERVKGGFAYGVTHMEEAIRVLTSDLPFTFEQIYAYLQILNWELEPIHKQALLRFYQLAFEVGLLQHVPEIEFAEVKL